MASAASLSFLWWFDCVVLETSFHSCHCAWSLLNCRFSQTLESQTTVRPWGFLAKGELKVGKSESGCSESVIFRQMVDVMNIYSFLIFLLSITQLPMCWSHDRYHLITLVLSLSFQHSTLSMPITFRSYLAIILDHLLYCPMLLSFILSTQPVIYLIVFISLTFWLIVLHSALFLLDILLHLSLGIIPYCHYY